MYIFFNIILLPFFVNYCIYFLLLDNAIKIPLEGTINVQNKLHNESDAQLLYISEWTVLLTRRCLSDK